MSMGLEDSKTMTLKLKSQTNRSWVKFSDEHWRKNGWFLCWMRTQTLSVSWTAGWPRKHDLFFPSSGCCFSSKMREVWIQRAKGSVFQGHSEKLCSCVTLSPVSWLYAFTSNTLIPDLQIGTSGVRVPGLVVVTHTSWSQEWSQQAEHSMFSLSHDC